MFCLRAFSGLGFRGWDLESSGVWGGFGVGHDHPDLNQHRVLRLSRRPYQAHMLLERRRETWPAQKEERRQ